MSAFANESFSQYKCAEGTSPFSAVAQRLKIGGIWMEDYKLGTMEARFADLIWKWEPVSSGDLVKRCKMEFPCNKSTKNPRLRRLCHRGIF